MHYILRNVSKILEVIITYSDGGLLHGYVYHIVLNDT